MSDNLPEIPRERDYPETARGSIDFARDIGEWMRFYIDKRNEHRRAAIDMLATSVGEALADLERGDRRPGWVQVQVTLLRADIAALSEENRSIRRRQWAVIITSIGAMMSLVVSLTVEVLRAQGKS